MSQKFSIKASPRYIVGKKVKDLRHQGWVPAVVYGPDFETTNVALEAKPLRQLLLQAGGTQLIDLDIDGKMVPTLAREVQRDPIRGEILHVDFYRVAMDREIRADLPVMIIHTSPLVDSREAVIITHLTSITVETLPANLPPHIEIDATTLTEIGQTILVGDLDLPADVKVLTGPEEMLVKLDYPQLAAEDEEVIVEEGAAEPELIRERHEDEDAE